MFCSDFGFFLSFCASIFPTFACRLWLGVWVSWVELSLIFEPGSAERCWIFNPLLFVCPNHIVVKNKRWFFLLSNISIARTISNYNTKVILFFWSELFSKFYDRVKSHEVVHVLACNGGWENVYSYLIIKPLKCNISDTKINIIM